MAKRRLTMRKIREIMRLKKELGLSDRQVARSLKISHSTVRSYQKRIELAGLTWPMLKEMSEEEILSSLFPQKQKPKSQRAEPGWRKIDKDLRKKGVTRMLLWQEYLEEYPAGYSYSQFCELYIRWLKQQDKPVLRQVAKAGEKVQVDYAGLTAQISDPETGEKHKAEIFVGVIGAGGLIYTEAHWKQNLAHWTQAHVRMFNYFGGVPEIVVPDNLKAAVTRACYYEPDTNPTYHELAVHYGVAVIPARKCKPRDKALAENAVLQVERWVLAPLRNQKFFSLYELNQAMRRLLEKLNQRKRSDNDLSRQEMFEELDKPELRPLPEHLFEYTEVKYAKVHIDYHVTFKKHHYSVPYTYTRKKVLIRATENVVEVYFQHRRIACHSRHDKYGFSTQKEHMPANHRQYLEWSPERFLTWAEKYGENTRSLISSVLSSRRHPQQAYRSCLGILKFGDKYSHEHLELACGLAVEVEAYSYKAVKHILNNKKDMLDEAISQKEPVSHEHVRGSNYYN